MSSRQSSKVDLSLGGWFIAPLHPISARSRGRSLDLVPRLMRRPFVADGHRHSDDHAASTSLESASTLIVRVLRTLFAAYDYAQRKEPPCPISVSRRPGLPPA